MTNATNTPIDRRAAVAALASLPTFALPQPASASPTAMLAAIACHRSAALAFREACRRTDQVAAEQEGREVAEADSVAYDAADAAEALARDEAFATPILTAGDLHILVTWAAEFQDDWPLEVGPRLLNALRVSALLTS